MYARESPRLAQIQEFPLITRFITVHPEKTKSIPRVSRELTTFSVALIRDFDISSGFASNGKNTSMLEGNWDLQ